MKAVPSILDARSVIPYKILCFPRQRQNFYELFSSPLLAINIICIFLLSIATVKMRVDKLTKSKELIGAEQNACDNAILSEFSGI